MPKIGFRDKASTKNSNKAQLSKPQSSYAAGKTSNRKVETKKPTQKNNLSHVGNERKLGSDLPLDQSDNLANEMATTNETGKFDLSYGGNQDEEQETDLDESPLGGNQENESTGLLANFSSKDAPDRLDRKSRRTFESSLSNDDDLKLAGASNNRNNSSNEILLPQGWEQHSDKLGLYYWHVTSGIIQRTRPTSEILPRKESVVIYHDDEEINQAPKTSSDDEDEYYESGAALTVNDSSDCAFVVYPLGSCEFDETQLLSSSSTKAIQKCILRLLNRPSSDETHCWGLDQSQPVLMELFDDHIQFTDIKTRTLVRSQPIGTIKTWAVDDDNNFAFVIEGHDPHTSEALATDCDELEYALINEQTLMCHVFRSDDDDDMSCKVAAKLSEQINRYKEQISDRITKSTRMQQMVEQPIEVDNTDVEDFDELEASNEMTMNVKYIGMAPVSRPTGIEILNLAIDKCLADATKMVENHESSTGEPSSPLIDAKLHVSPSSVIVENVSTGEIIVECRIRYLTFMGISKRDIRWCGFIMQNAGNKTFAAHCFECHPTAGHVCDAIQVSCTKMYEKVVKSSTRKPDTISIIPSSSKIRHTLAKTFSRIKLSAIN